METERSVGCHRCFGFNKQQVTRHVTTGKAPLCVCVCVCVLSVLCVCINFLFGCICVVCVYLLCVCVYLWCVCVCVVCCVVFVRAGGKFLAMRLL